MKEDTHFNSSMLKNEIHDNEVATNKAVAGILLLFFVLPVIMDLVMMVRYSKGMSTANDYVFFPTGFLILIIDGLALKLKFDRPWIKYMLLGSFVLMTIELYFVYTTCAIYFLFLPIFVAARYFDRNQIRWVALTTFVLFLVASALNIILTPYSSLIQLFHRNSCYDFWNDPIDVLVFIILPFFVVVLFLFRYVVKMSKTGRHLIGAQAAINGQIAKVNAELNMAAEIQKSVLPHGDFSCPDGHFVIAASEKTAREVGGDFYDYFMIDDHTLAVLVADVSDKGVPAALFMMSAKKVIDTALRYTRNLQEAAKIINQLICDDNKSGMFLTLWLGVIDTRSGCGKYINAGHLPPIIKHADGSVTLLENEPDLFIGTFPESPPAVHFFSLSAGDVLLLYTDGVTDAMNHKGESYGESALIQIVSQTQPKPDLLLKAIEAELLRFKGETEQFDDETLLILGCVHTEDKVMESISVPAVRQGTEKVLNWLDQLLKELSCPDEARRDLEMMTDELCCNICEYAYASGGEMEIEAVLCQNAVTLTFKDRGKPFDPLKNADPVFTDEPNFGGLGIYLVRQKADVLSYEYHNGENCLILTKVWNM